jgi:hypothetical protein
MGRGSTGRRRLLAARRRIRLHGWYATNYVAVAALLHNMLSWARALAMVGGIHLVVVLGFTALCVCVCVCVCMSVCVCV